MASKKELERALELAVKNIVRYHDETDCSCICPLDLECPVQGKYLKKPERSCAIEVKAHFLKQAKAKI